MKKAFTLIELISVIIIIGVVALISTPIVTNIIDKSKEKAYKNIVENIEQSAYNYSIANDLGYKQSYESIGLKTLQVKGYMENDKIIDPRNNTQMEGCVFYRWLLESKQYEFIYDDDCTVDDILPEIKINVLNENKFWLQENLRFQIDSKYDSYKYCVGSNECEIDNEYKGTTTVEKDGKNIYVCAVGYFGDVPGKSICVGPYNVDTVSPEIISNKVTYTSSKIVVNATCSDTLSLVKEIKYSINGGEYQESNLFTNLKTGEYKVKTKCVDNALNESEVEATVELKMSAPTIAQVSQTPSSGEWAQKRVIRITYNSVNVESPKYYYSLDNSTWIEVTSTTKDIEFTSNGYLYAKTVDNAGNTASAAAFTVVNVDSTKPSASIAVSNVKTDRATITATCSDNESKISKYEFSKDNGATWVNNGTTASYTFTGLTQGISYTYKVRCTNGSGMTNEASSAESTSSITKPTIAQISQTPSSGTYAQSRVIKVTYTATNIQTPEYYFKSSVAATVASGVVTHACGTSTNPGTCSASSVTTLAANTWYKTSSTTPSITYTQNGYLYAQTWDPADNTAAASTFTITNVDTAAPTVNVAVSGKVATITLKDNLSLAGYAVNTSSTAVSSWTSVTGTSASESWTATEAGTYYAWVKDVSGRTAKYEFKIEQSAFCSLEAGETWTFAYTGNIEELDITCNGTYKLEVWGAQGGTNSTSAAAGGKGGYSSGNINLTSGQTLYIGVGGAGAKGGAAPFNGGSSNNDVYGAVAGTGGGATHIATSTGVLPSLENNKESILIVAGGGGGSVNSYAGGVGGGLSGTNGKGTEPGYGASQTAGGSNGTNNASYAGKFGQGGNSLYSNGSGGGGYYGGGGACGFYESGGGGGSSYIDGLIAGKTIAGDASMPTHDGTSTMTGNSGNGYARITYLSTNDELGYKCKRATTLHTETCAQTNSTYYCSGAGYTASGSKKTTTITYGNLATKGKLVSGDAFDCDVNGDGTYDSTTERFYYVSDLYNTTTKTFDSNYAVLVYYNNTTKGVADNKTSSIVSYNSNLNNSSAQNWFGPVTSITNLPTTTQWKNVSLTNTSRAIINEANTGNTGGGTLPTSFSYAGYAARLITTQEITSTCGRAGSYSIGELNTCNYLMENTKFSNNSMGTNGFWIENPCASNSYSAWNIDGASRFIDAYYVYSTDDTGVRPAIEVLKTDIEI